MSATVTAIANLKGGVGKSTTTVMLADGLSYFYGLNVLVIDLDAQANSSQMLLTEQGVDAASKQGKGAHHLLGQFLDGKKAAAAPFIMPNAVSIEELRVAEMNSERLGWIAALPANPQLRMDEMSLEEEWYSRTGTPTTLSEALARHFENGFADLLPLYDVILLDCPPHLSPLSRAGLALADVFVLPTLADPVSGWGTKQFISWVKDNLRADLTDRSFSVITRFKNTSYARQMRNELQNITLKDVWFGPNIPESVDVLRAMERPAPDSYDTFRGKYGKMKNEVRRLSDEFVDFLVSRRWEIKPERFRD
ncbi:MAG: ParA family protein [Pseudomonadota bacterium]